MNIDCPECKQTVPEAACVRVDVTLSSGDDFAGSSSTATATLCGGCAQAVSTKYVGFAVEQFRARAAAALSGR